MLVARIFKVSFGERRVPRGGIFEVWSVPSNKLHPFGLESLIRWKLMHLRSFLASVLAALTFTSASKATTPSSTFWFPTVIHVGLLLCTQSGKRRLKLCHENWSENFLTAFNPSGTWDLIYFLTWVPKTKRFCSSHKSTGDMKLLPAD